MKTGLSENAQSGFHCYWLFEFDGTLQKKILLRSGRSNPTEKGEELFFDFGLDPVQKRRVAV